MSQILCYFDGYEQNAAFLDYSKSNFSHSVRAQTTAHDEVCACACVICVCSMCGVRHAA